MLCMMKSPFRVVASGSCILVATLFSQLPAVYADGNVVLALDGMIVNNTGGGQPGWGGFGRFNYGDNTVGLPVPRD